MGINMRAVMLDTQGPEIRTGMFGGDVKGVELSTGDTVDITTDEAVRYPGRTESLCIIIF
jgi:pyruvate kinase